MLISKTARKYALNTQYALNNEGKNWPHPQNRDACLVARVHDSKWVCTWQVKKNESRTNAMIWEWLCVLIFESRVVEIVDIISLKFASDEAAGGTAVL